MKFVWSITETREDGGIRIGCSGLKGLYEIGFACLQGMASQGTYILDPNAAGPVFVFAHRGFFIEQFRMNFFLGK